MIIDEFYLTDPTGFDRLYEYTELALDEVEQIVGRFRADHHWAGLLKGQVRVHEDKIEIVHHFTKKRLWTTMISVNGLRRP